jgi:1-acyl-sn-glycerol-3-phosphate acyltransferase
MGGDRKPPSAFTARRKTPVFHGMKSLAELCLRPFFRIEVWGLKNLPLEEAFVLAPKHRRWEDIPLLGMATPRPLYYMAKIELFRNPLTGWFLGALGGIPLDRARPLATRESLRRMIGYLKAGEGVVVFPEGTYFADSLGPGRVGLIRMIHARFHIPFVPVGVRYGREGPRTRVEIHYGAPIWGGSASSPKALTDRIMQEIGRLSGLIGGL